MNKGLIIGLASVAIIGLAIFFTAISWYNGAISLEEATKAQFRENQNEYDSFWKKVQEIAQVPNAYKEDLKSLLVSETTAKYGPNGSSATFQWFQDRNVNLDPSMYKKIQDVIESGRDDFKQSQTELVDKQRVYSVKLKSFWGRLFAGLYDMPGVVAGVYAPKTDMDGDGKLTVLDYPIVTSAKTKEIFSTGEDNAPVDVFQRSK